VVFSLLLSACDQFSNSDPALEQRLTKTENELAALQQQITALRQEREWDDVRRDFD
jgi:prefoldin subunit 5